MEIKKLVAMSNIELRSEEASVGQQIFRIRFQKSLGNQEGIKNLRSLKLEVARIKTILRSRDLSELTGSSVEGSKKSQSEQEKKGMS